MLKVLKTRDQYLVQCSIPLTIDSNLICEEEYIFPDDQLLLKCELGHLKTLKSMFSKQVLVEMKFLKEKLQFKNPDTLQEYDIQCKSLDKHGVYLSRDEN